MQKVYVSVFFICFILTIRESRGEGCLLYPVSLEDRISSSEFIVEGKVAAKNSFWNQEHTHIYTSNSIQVYKIFKGQFHSSYVSLITEGGVIGLNAEKVEPSLQVNAGDYGIFFLKNAPENIKNANSDALFYVMSQYVDYAGPQSFIPVTDEGRVQDIFFQYENDNDAKKFYERLALKVGRNFIEEKSRDEELLQQKLQSSDRFMPAPTISSFSPSNVKAGTLAAASVLTINGSNFGATRGTSRVDFRDADNGGVSYINNTIAVDYLSWSDTQIQVRVPDGSGTGTFQVITSGGSATSASTLTVDYDCLWITYNPGTGNQRYEPDLINDNGSGGYTLTFNSTFYSNTPAVDAFRRALNNWVSNTGVNFVDAGATTSGTTTTSNDGINIITFASLSSGVLGTSYSYYSGCSSGGTVYWYVSDIDLRFQNSSGLPGGTTWNYGPAASTSSQYDFESVTLHELGHHHQLGHIINSSGVMHYAIANGQDKRVLNASSDIAGGNYVLSHSTVANPCGPGPMTTSAAPVQLIYFCAKNISAEEITLEWATAQEQNNMGFQVERSTDKNNFEKISFVDGKGNSSEENYYSLKDIPDLHASVYYYRLKQFDFNGGFEYSPTVEVQIMFSNAFDFLVTPNVVSEQTTLRFNLPSAGEIKIDVYDLSGRKLQGISYTFDGGGKYSEALDVRKFASGMYFIKSSFNGQDKIQKLIKQ